MVSSDVEHSWMDIIKVRTVEQGDMANVFKWIQVMLKKC